MFFDERQYFFLKLPMARPGDVFVFFCPYDLGSVLVQIQSSVKKGTEEGLFLLNKVPIVRIARIKKTQIFCSFSLAMFFINAHVSRP